MNITFDPMTEAAAVRRMLDALLDQDVTIGTFPMIDSDESRRAPLGAVAGPSIAELQNAGHLPASAVPLPPAAPSTAAADVFPTAPEVPTPGAVTPPPVAVPPVPSVPTPAAPSAPAGATNPVAVDKNGLPWDERIHAGTKTQNADGSWRQRRGLDNPDYVASIENELRAALRVAPLPPTVPNAVVPAAPIPEAPAIPVTVPAAPIATAPATGTATPPLPATAAPEVPNAAPASSAVPTAPIPTPPVPPVPTAPASTATPISFAQVMTKVTELHRAGKVVDADVHGALAAVGLVPNEIGKLAKQDEATAAFRQTVATILDDIAGGA